MSLYRQYEDPRKLEKELALAEMQLAAHPGDEHVYEYVCELRDRINFAWQDEEYDEISRDDL